MMETEEQPLEWSRYLLSNGTSSYNETAEDYDDDYIEVNTGSVESLYMPRITAFVSLFAVVCVFVEAFLDLRQAHKQHQNNIIVANSSGSGCNRVRSSRAQINFSTVSHVQLFYQIPLFCYALAQALGSNPVPKDLDVWGASGNTATCNFQGALLQFGTVGVFLWDAALSATYLTMARVHRTEDIQRRMQFRKKLYHCLIWPFLLFLTIYPLVTGLYNFGYNICWLHEYPNDCDQRDDIECISGAGASFWSTLVSLIAVVHIIYSITVMICLWRTIRHIENRTQAHARNSSTITETSQSVNAHNNRRYSKAVGIQGLWYASGMLITTLPTATFMIVFNVTGHWSEGFSVFALMMSPLVGYVNFCIFMRNRKVEDCHTKYGKFLRKAHAWMLDYDLFCQCKCKCLPRWMNRKGDEGNTAPSSLPPAPFDNNNNNNAPAYGPGKPHYPQQAQRQQQQHSEESGYGLLTGFMIKLKGESEQPFISALGTESRDKAESDHWIDASPQVPKRFQSEAVVVEPNSNKKSELLSATVAESETENNSAIQLDASPMIPKRVRSEVEPVIASHNVNPPTQPTRAPSEVEQGLNNHNVNDKATGVVGGRAPAKPIRAISSFLHSVGEESSSYEDEDDVLPQQMTEGNGSEKEHMRTTPNREPATAGAATGENGFLIRVEQGRDRPSQLVSELGLSSVGEYCDSENWVDESPNQPKRLRSQVEDVSPPTQPRRAVSEVGQDMDVSDKPAVGGRAPPTKPMRVESTVLQSVVENEDEEEVASFGDEESSPAPRRNSSSMLPGWLNRNKAKLSMLRSSLNARGGGSNRRRSAPTAAAAGKPNQQQHQQTAEESTAGLGAGVVIKVDGNTNRPSQLVSELGMCSVGDSESEDNDELVNGSPREPTRKQIQPPKQPTRFVSEAEEMDVSDKAVVAGGKAPIRPIRIESTLLHSLAEDVDYEEEEDDGGGAPRHPVRMVSEVEEMDDNGKAVVGGNAPTRPLRIESTVLQSVFEGEDDYSL